MSTRVTYQAAMNAPDFHRLEAGVGYTRVGRLPMPTTGSPSNCSPPDSALEGSVHLLRPPQSLDPRAFIWNKSKGLWLAFNSNSKRLGYSPEYLSRHGWAYLRPSN
jgi:hypothetical protein